MNESADTAPFQVKRFRFSREHILIAGGAIACLWYLLAAKGLVSISGFPGRFIAVYRMPAIGLAFFCMLLLIGCWQQFRIQRRPDGSLSLAAIPLLILGCLVSAAWSKMTAGLLFLYGMPLLWSWILVPRLENAPPENDRPHRRRDTWLILVLFTFFYTAAGTYFTKSVGAHSSDEGHYLIQALSLYKDGDLDLRNNIENHERANKKNLHISEFSRGGAWYSWHPPGLSFLLAVTWPLGVIGRHLMLGFFSGLALSGCYALARQMGANRRYAWLAVLLFGLSVYWGVYSSRALPEVLGAALAVWAYYQCGRQASRPVSSTLCMLACVGFLPVVQTRFLPVGLLIMFFFFWRIITSPVLMRDRFRRALLFLAACLAALAAYYAFQFKFFEGGNSYPVSKLFFTYPLGMWHTLASYRGILFALPAFSCLLAAAIYRAKDRGPAWAGLEPLLLLLAVITTSCATKWFTAGATLPGRFLLVILPVLIANLALVLSRSPSSFRYLAVYLGIIPVFAFTGLLAVLPELGKSFSNAHECLRSHGLFGRMPSFMYDPYETTRLFPALLLYAGTGVLLLWRSGTRNASFARMLVLLAALAFFAKIPPARSADALRIATQLSFLSEKGGGFHVCRGERNQPVALLDYSNRYGGAMTNRIHGVTTETLAAPVVGFWVSQPLIEMNDWEGQGHRWATLVPPLKVGKEKLFFRLRGRASGGSPVEIAIREGTVTHYRAMIPPGELVDLALKLETRKAGDLYTLARIDGASGAFHTETIACSAYTDDLLSSANITLD